MSKELQFSYKSAATTYVLIRSINGLIWNGSAFAIYLTSNYTDYPVSATEQGTASAYYTANFPSTIGAGEYEITAKQQLTGSPAETDPTIAVGTYQWNGSNTLPLSDLATSGQVSAGFPQRIARGVMILNWPIYLKSSADHVTPFVSGILSGQIARDNGSFGPLQSGAFTETGLGWYTLQAITSGDINALTVKLLFTANGISGGTSDPLPLSFITQRTSGY